MSLTVNGSGFSSGAQVKITMGASTINATGESLTGSTVITCSLDLNSASTGTYDVTVTNSDTQSGTKSNAFTVNQGADPAPVILSINPTSADAGQVIPFTLFGIDLGQGAQMTLEMGATVIEAASESVTGISIMNGTIDLTSAPDGLYDVVVTNPDGQSGSLVDRFGVDNPDMRFHLAAGYRANGRTRDAVKELESLLAKYKSFDTLTQARAMLSDIKSTGK